MAIELLSETAVFGGVSRQYKHHASTVNCAMNFTIYLPPKALSNQKVPVLYWLSGLTCTDENFTQKSGAQRIAAELGIAIVATDTSPRGEGVADDDSYDLGQGAGFYVNATQAPWQKHYQMYDYILHELPEVIEGNFSVSKQRAIAGHSMGGHGALTIGLLNPEKYSSISAFSPIVNPINCPWGIKAFTQYLGDNQKNWQDHDASHLISKANQHTPIKVDQGEADSFLAEQLKPEQLISAAKANDYPLEYQLHKGYDHSYFFIASFIEAHLRFHAKYFAGE